MARLPSVMTRESEIIWRWPVLLGVFDGVHRGVATGHGQQGGSGKREKNSRFHFNLNCVTSNGLVAVMDLT